MMSLIKSFPLLVLAAALSACQQNPPNNQLLIFLNNEKGLKPYQTRIIVTPAVVRLDDGAGSKSYTLFDRKSRIARSVDLEQHTVLIIRPKSLKVKPPIKLQYSMKDLGEMKDAPKVMGKTARHFQQYTNKKLCYDVIAIKGMMPHAVKALKEYHEMLASDSMVTVNNMPADMQDPCELARSTYAPTQSLEHGFPIQLWRKGYSRMLVDYKQHYQPDPKLFEIPSGYFTYSVQQIRDGLVDLDNRKILSPPKTKKK
jgi:hypothetical protein